MRRSPFIGYAVDGSFTINDKSLDNNEYVKAYKKRMKESIRLRTNSLLKKIEKS
jgi:hypothetical protein